ncbi:hypothetical protein BTVI_77762 [Pitangus sulphuratus]|nr:hypothetical protein BTVI_77762 [Pitangus sulphuratus]
MKRDSDFLFPNIQQKPKEVTHKDAAWEEDGPSMSLSSSPAPVTLSNAYAWQDWNSQRRKDECQWPWSPQTPVQVAQRNCECPIPGSVQGQVRWGFEQPGLVEGFPAHGRSQTCGQHFFFCGFFAFSSSAKLDDPYIIFLE